MISTSQSTRFFNATSSSRGFLGIGGGDIGNTIDKAKDVGLLKKGTGIYKHSEDVGGTDLNFFKFKLDSTTLFSARLKNQKRSGETSLSSLTIVTSSGATVKGSDGKSLFKNNIQAGTTKSISTNLAAGTYYIRLQSPEGSGQNYKLRLAASAS